MSKPLFWLGLPAAIFGLCLAGPAAAQCPVAALCTPGPASSTFAAAAGMGIFNVSLGAIANPTGGNTDGYQDNSCTLTATLTVGQRYPVAVTTSAGENVRIWADYNNDGQFDPVQELFFTSNNAQQHTGLSQVVPTTAVTGTALRLRVSADAGVSPLPTPCSTPVYSQVEDYGVRVLASARPPSAAFAAVPGPTCGAAYAFQDQSAGVPTSWRWSFGDGTGSTQQNPSHAYSTPGTFSVKLRVCNAFGCDSVEQTGAATVFATYPAPATCQPATLNYCCNYGVTRVTFGSLSYASADGRAGYEDFSCTQRATVAQGAAVPLILATSSNAQNTWVYLDANNDGAFTANELLFQALGRRDPQGFVTIPRTALTNQALRLRIITDAVGGSAQPCAARTSGQVEDCAVVVTPVACPAPVQGGRIDGFISSNNSFLADSIDYALVLSGYSAGSAIQWQRSARSNPPVWRSIVGGTGPTYFVKQAYNRSLDTLYRALVTCGTTSVPTANYYVFGGSARNNLHLNYCSLPNSPVIQRVRLAGTTLDHGSGCGQPSGAPYVFHDPTRPSQTATVLRGETYQLDVTPSYAGPIAVFVVNQNQVALPALVVPAAAAGVPAHLFLRLDSLRLPANTTAVQLRVRCGTPQFVGSPPYQEGTYSSGETEDYILRVARFTCADPVSPGYVAGVAGPVCRRDSVHLSLLETTPGTRLQWQTSPDSLTWADAAGQTGRTFVAAFTAPTYYRVQVSGCTGAVATPAVRVRLRPVAECYCGPATATAVPAAAPYLTRVKIVGTTLDNPSVGGGPGLVRYAPTAPTQTAELVRGATYTLELTVANPGAGVGSQLDAVAWLDLNRDGRYDSLEWVHLLRTAATPATTTYQTTLPVGVWAAPGAANLRLRVGNGVAFRPTGACATAPLPAGRGETEDYTVSFLVPPCAGTLTAGTVDYQANTAGVCRSRLRSTSYTPGADLQWQSSPTGQAPWQDLAGATADEWVAWTTEGSYRLRVSCGGATAYSAAVQPTAPGTPCGCATQPVSNDQAVAYVDGVEIVGTPLVNTGTGVQSYAEPILGGVQLRRTGRWAPQMQGFTATLLRGSSYPLRLAAVGEAVIYTPTGTSVAAWVDWNHNGAFEASEYYGALAAAPGVVTYATTLAVPPTAALGLTMLRVVARENPTSAQGCAFGYYTETEDYFVTVADQPALAVPVLTAGAVPRCQGATLQLGANGAGPGVRYDWLGPAGFVAINTATPTRPGLTAAHGGTYIAVVTRNGERLLTSLYVPVDTCHVALAAHPAAQSARLTLYPNPTPGWCMLQVPTVATTQLPLVTVRNATGQPVPVPVPEWQLRPGASGVDSFKVDLRALPAGLYLVEVITKSGHLTGKVVRE